MSMSSNVSGLNSLLIYKHSRMTDYAESLVLEGASVLLTLKEEASSVHLAFKGFSILG